MTGGQLDEARFIPFIRSSSIHSWHPLRKKDAHVLMRKVKYMWCVISTCMYDVWVIETLSSILDFFWPQISIRTGLRLISTPLTTMWISEKSNLNGNIFGGVKNTKINGRGKKEQNIWENSAKYILWLMAGKGSLDGFAALTSEKHKRPNNEDVCLENNSHSVMMSWAQMNSQIQKRDAVL